jgi:hypothetical protein
VFGVLQAWFAIVSQTARSWQKLELHKIMKACIILHNLIVEDERASPKDFDYDQPTALVEPGQSESADFSLFVQNVLHLQSDTDHY